MAAVFTAASSQRMRNASPWFTDYPWSCGFWYKPNDITGLYNVISLADTAVTDNYFRVAQNVATMLITATAGATPNNASVSTLVAGRWHYVIGRFIATANRRISMLDGAGLITHGNTTTSRAVTGVDAMGLGALITSSSIQFLDGSVAELWYANTDVQADGAANTDNTIVRRLAWGGPFSLPRLCKDIVEYRSFREHAWGGEGRDIYFGRSAQIWLDQSTTGTITTGPHPPLPGNYRNPRDVSRLALV